MKSSSISNESQEDKNLFAEAIKRQKKEVAKYETKDGMPPPQFLSFDIKDVIIHWPKSF